MNSLTEASNNSLVNSLFEESNKVEEYDNETLSNVMRSLEAEIIAHPVSQTEEQLDSYQEEMMLSEFMEQMNGCSSASQDWEFPCVESTSNWSLEDIEYMMMVDGDGVNQWEGVDHQEYSLDYYTPTIAFEDDNYNSLWNCTNDFMIYE